MKKHVVLIVVWFIAIAGIRAQGTSVPALQHSNTFYYLADGNQPTVLEKTVASMQTKMKMAGFGGSSTSYVIEGNVAATEINSSQPSFAIRIDNMMASMLGASGNSSSSMFRLYRFEKKGESRVSILSKSGFMGKGNSQQEEGIRFNVNNTNNNVLVLTPEKQLTPGEYAFINMMAPAAGSGGRGGTSPSYTAYFFAIR